jgi:hypothetical protein
MFWQWHIMTEWAFITYQLVWKLIFKAYKYYHITTITDLTFKFFVYVLTTFCMSVTSRKLISHEHLLFHPCNLHSVSGSQPPIPEEISSVANDFPFTLVSMQLKCRSLAYEISNNSFWLDDLSSNPGRGKFVSLQNDSGIKQVSYPIFIGEKWSEHEADNSPVQRLRVSGVLPPLAL